jgi:hypothetical protein
VDSLDGNVVLDQHGLRTDKLRFFANKSHNSFSFSVDKPLDLLSFNSDQVVSIETKGYMEQLNLSALLPSKLKNEKFHYVDVRWEGVYRFRPISFFGQKMIHPYEDLDLHTKEITFSQKAYPGERYKIAMHNFSTEDHIENNFNIRLGKTHLKGTVAVEKLDKIYEVAFQSNKAMIVLHKSNFDFDDIRTRFGLPMGKEHPQALQNIEGKAWLKFKPLVLQPEHLKIESLRFMTTEKPVTYLLSGTVNWEKTSVNKMQLNLKTAGKTFQDKQALEFLISENIFLPTAFSR